MDNIKTMSSEQMVSLIEEKLNELIAFGVFLGFQCELGITSGDEDPLMSLQYDEKVNDLAKHILETIKYQVITNGLDVNSIKFMEDWFNAKGDE